MPTLMPTKGTESAACRALSEATLDDWRIINHAESEYRRSHGPGRGLMTMLASLAQDDPLGVPVNLYRHCLQTATRVLEAGLDDELVVGAVIHDLTEAFRDKHHR